MSSSLLFPSLVLFPKSVLLPLPPLSILLVTSPPSAETSPMSGLVWFSPAWISERACIIIAESTENFVIWSTRLANVSLSWGSSCRGIRVVDNLHHRPEFESNQRQIGLCAGNGISHVTDRTRESACKRGSVVTSRYGASR